MNLSGTPIDIIHAVTRQYPEIPSVLKQARSIVPPSARAIAEYQAAALYALAKLYDKPGARVLEIGTAQGYSAAILALALPTAEIITLNPHETEAPAARKSLAPFGERIQVIEQKSWDYLETYDGEPFDVIFVDGDHKNVRRDFPWYDSLRVSGLMLFHDFSPNGTPRACPPVYRALLEMKEALGRDFDVLVVDDEGVGMAGFVKQEADMLKNATKEALATAHAYSSAGYNVLVSLYQLAHEVKVDGAVIEAGAQNGGSAAALALGYKDGHLKGRTDPKVWLFDSFTGVPRPSPEDGEKAMARYEANQSSGGWAIGNKENVREVFKSLSIKGAKVIEGEFSDTFANDAYKIGKVAILHIDATLYDSTRLTLERFYDHVEDGGLVVLSAFHHWQGIRLAAEQYFAERGGMPAYETLEKAIYWHK